MPRWRCAYQTRRRLAISDSVPSWDAAVQVDEYLKDLRGEKSADSSNVSAGGRVTVGSPKPKVKPKVGADRTGFVRVQKLRDVGHLQRTSDLFSSFKALYCYDDLIFSFFPPHVATRRPRL